MRKAVDCCAYSKPATQVECKKKHTEKICKTHQKKPETFHYCIVFSQKETYGIFQVASANEDVEAWTNDDQKCFPDFYGCIHFETNKKLEIGERRKVVSLESIDQNMRSASHFETFSTQGPVDDCVKWTSARISHYYEKELAWTSSISEETHHFSDELHTEEFHDDEEEDFLFWQFIIEYASGEVKEDPRGQKQNIEEVLHPFSYRWCLDFEKDSPEAQQRVVSKVQFDISRYGKHTKTITFPEKVTIAEAVEAAERYLSAPLDEEYYNTIRDDLFHKATWEKAKKHFQNRGQCLTDLIFLEFFDESETEEGLFIVWCGS